MGSTPGFTSAFEFTPQNSRLPLNGVNSRNDNGYNTKQLTLVVVLNYRRRYGIHPKFTSTIEFTVASELASTAEVTTATIPNPPSNSAGLLRCLSSKPNWCSRLQ